MADGQREPPTSARRDPPPGTDAAAGTDAAPGADPAPPPVVPVTTDERLTLARTALENTLAQKTAARSNVRGLAMTVLGAAAVSAAFGAKSLSDTATHPGAITVAAAAIGLIAFAVMSFCTARIIWSHDNWTFGTSGVKVSNWQLEGKTMDEINRLVVDALIAGREANEKSITSQSSNFKVCVVLLLVVVLVSLVVIGTARL